MNRIIRLLSLFAFLSVLTASAVAQVATAELHVSVKDPKGATIGNATVIVKNEASGLERTQTANVEGEYPFRALPPGRYEITVDAPGFAKGVAKDVRITVGQMAELPVTLAVAGTTEVVNVTSEAELIETQRTTAATTIEQARIENLPINGRNYINFALTNSQLARDTAPSIGAAPTSGLNVSGQRARNNLVNVDGMDAVDNSTNGIRSTVSQEAVQEFQLLTNGYTAEYGRASGGVVNIITKSGTNDIHGSAFGYLRNRNIQAVNPFSTIPDPAYTRVQAGFTLGGTLKKDRTFYFLSAEFTRRRESGYSSIGQNNFGLTSTADISRFYGRSAGSLVVPVTPAQAPVLAVLPVNAQTQQYATLVGMGGVVALTGHNPVFGGGAYFPAPDAATHLPLALPTSFVPLQSLVGNFPVTEATDIYSVRLDHRLTNNHQLLLRAGVSPSNADGIQVQAQGPQNFGQNAWSRTSRQDYHDWSLTGQETWTIGTNKINEFRYQFSRRGLLYTYSKGPGGSGPGVNIPGFAFFGREPFSFVNRTELRHQMTDNFSLTLGKHSLKWGGDVNILPLQADFTVNFGAVYNFGEQAIAAGLPPLSPIQAYGAGIPSNFIQGVGNPHDAFTNTAMGYFFQDSWRVAKNFTLNLGVRYDVELTPTFKATTALAQAAQDKLGLTQGIPRDYNNFAPRLGFAWDPFGDNRTVIRGSYGLFYDHPLLALAFNSDVADGSQAPQLVFGPGSPADPSCSLNAYNMFTGRGSCLPAAFNYLANEQRFNPTPNAPSIFSDQGFLTAGIPLSFLPWTLPTGKNFVYPYSEQASFGVEHDLGHNLAIGLQYNFSAGKHLNRPINVNAVRTDLLVRNWQLASAAGDVGAISGGPLAVGNPAAGSVAPCGLGPGGQPWVSPAFINFFRPSGLNPSYKGALAGPAAGCAPLVNAVLSGLGLGYGVDVPFSDTTGNFSNGSSVYHGLTVTGRKRFSHNYEFLVSYTWSHAIDDSTDLQSPLAPQNNYQPNAERSNSLFDQRHRFVISGVYQTGSKRKGFAGVLANDWTFAPILEFASGRPFMIISGIDQNFDFGTGGDRPNTATAGQINGCGQTAVASRFSPTGYLLPQCYVDVVAAHPNFSYVGHPEYFVGNLPRNYGTKPMTIFNDIRVSRRINISERFKLDAIADLFNVVNRNNTADVNPIWNLAGQPTAAFDPRQLQLAVRLSW